MTFDATSFPLAVPARQLAAFSAAWEWLGRPGASWTGAEKVAIAEVARTATPRALWDRRPITIEHLAAVPAPAEVLAPLTIDTAERVAVEAATIGREWAAAAIDALGDSAYAELVAVIATVVPIDRACELLGRSLEPLPVPVDGAPNDERPDALVDIGAYLPVAADFLGANVAKSLSIAPTANMIRLGVVRALYSGTRFGELRWDDGALNRPQIELIAARTSALNECFY
jgi:hypothetical protein